MEQSTANPILFQRGCGCNSSNTSDLPIIYTSSNRVLEIHFSAVNMTALDDPDHLNFEATYEFMKLPLLCKEVKKLRGTSGTVHAGEDNVSSFFPPPSSPSPLERLSNWIVCDIPFAEGMPHTSMDHRANWWPIPIRANEWSLLTQTRIDESYLKSERENIVLRSMQHKGSIHIHQRRGIVGDCMSGQRKFGR